MKYYQLIAVFALLLFIGCSSTYKVSEFPSKEKFYEDFNVLVNNKSLKIVLNDDSIITADNGAKISDDSLFFSMRVQKSEKISRDEIKDIKYSGSEMSNLSAVILLKNGTETKAKNFNILPDSSINAIVYKDIHSYIPLDKIKEISNKKHWLGVPLGFLIGAGSGFIVGLSIIVLSTNSNTYSGPAQALPIWSSIGLVMGSIWGWLDGYTYIYEFNPPP